MNHTSGYLQVEPDPDDKTEMGVYGAGDTEMPGPHSPPYRKKGKGKKKK